MASNPKRGQHVVHPPAVIAAKVYLWNAFIESGKTKTEMAEALGLQRMTLNRLLDFFHRLRIEQLDKALQLLGKRLDLFVADLKVIAQRQHGEGIKKPPCWERLLLFVLLVFTLHLFFILFRIQYSVKSLTNSIVGFSFSKR